MAIKTLPPKYYRTHFFEFIEFLEIHYGSILEPEHSKFISDFRELSEDAQCIYIRMVNRKGLVFDRKTFTKYTEIENPVAAIQELEQKLFVEKLQLNHRVHLVDFLTKAKLRQWLMACGIKANIGLSGDQLKELGQNSIEMIEIEKFDTSTLISQGRIASMEYLLFLYFGRIQNSLTLYTLRDLGIRQSGTLKTQFKPRFTLRAHAQAEYFFVKHLESPLEKFALNHLKQVVDQSQNFQNLLASTQRLKDELFFRLAHCFIDEEIDIAIKIFNESNHPSAREKMARLLYKLDRKSECLVVLDAIQAQPRTDEELLFAEDFSERKFNKKRTGRLTEMLQSSSSLSISDYFIKRPEAGVSAYYEKLGYRATFTENRIWRDIFGVLFWEELFEQEDSGIHNPFERSPSDLVGPDFYLRNAVQIEQTLNMIQDEVQITKKVLDVTSKNFGRLNDIFQWRPNLAEGLIDFLIKTKKQNVGHVLRMMCRQFEAHHTGFPDLMLEKDGQIKFVEVKAEGDSLRPGQLSKLRLLKEAGFSVDIQRVQWETDPNQTYVVIDVETTGGSAHLHRITELAAVKIQNGRIIDEFQTLVNPDRPIPSFITGLTGITNQMVAEAPLFGEIANKVLEFTDGAVFVAHNVKFDYSFLHSEFMRIEVDFFRPQLCTCAGMRKAYPGLNSYGLKNLAEQFQISMEQHHRAMSDARAAAQLLLLMKAKRLQGIEENCNEIILRT